MGLAAVPPGAHRVSAGFNFGEHGRSRPQIDLGPDFIRPRAAFDHIGCRFDVRDAVGSLHLPPEFVARFDASIVMFAWPVIDRLWDVWKLRPVLLRTIGQGLDVFEPAHARLRGAGPVVVMHPAAIGLGDTYWEIGRLITPGVDALLVHDAQEAAAALRRLLDDHAPAARLRAAGRASAIRLFGRGHVGPEWRALLAGFA